MNCSYSKDNGEDRRGGGRHGKKGGKKGKEGEEKGETEFTLSKVNTRTAPQTSKTRKKS